MKLLQLNIWEGRLLRSISKLIEQENPDILCLQEVLSAQSTIQIPSMFNALETIQTAAKLEHVFFAPTVSSVYANKPVAFGNAILSRFPIEDTKTVFTNGAYRPELDTDNFVSNVRNLQIATIKLPEAKITIANHHAHWERDPMGNELSLERMNTVKAALVQSAQPLIFAGDLNVRSSSASLQIFNDFLSDLTAHYNITNTLSELGIVKDVDCDHVFVSEDVRVNSFRTSNALVSDHKALILDFSINP